MRRLLVHVTFIGLISLVLTMGLGAEGRSEATGVRQATTQGNAGCVDVRDESVKRAHADFNRAEGIAISKSNGQVTREACVLRIRTAKEEHRLTDKFEDLGSDISYTYQGKLTGTEFHVVLVGFYEGSAYELIGTQGRSRLVGLPILSPDRRRVIAASYDLYAGYNPNALEVWNIERSYAVLEISILSDSWGPSKALWNDSRTISLDQTSLDEKANEVTRKGARLRLTDTGWSFEPAK